MYVYIFFSQDVVKKPRETRYTFQPADETAENPSEFQVDLELRHSREDRQLMDDQNHNRTLTPNASSSSLAGMYIHVQKTQNLIRVKSKNYEYMYLFT